MQARQKLSQKPYRSPEEAELLRILIIIATRMSAQEPCSKELAETLPLDSDDTPGTE